MAKVILSEKQRRVDRLSRYIFGSIKAQGLTQEKVAAELSISRWTLNRKLENGSLTFTELWKLFQVLGTDKETIIKLIG